MREGRRTYHGLLSDDTVNVRHYLGAHSVTATWGGSRYVEDVSHSSWRLCSAAFKYYVTMREKSKYPFLLTFNIIFALVQHLQLTQSSDANMTTTKKRKIKEHNMANASVTACMAPSVTIQKYSCVLLPNNDQKGKPSE